MTFIQGLVIGTFIGAALMYVSEKNPTMYT